LTKEDTTGKKTTFKLAQDGTFLEGQPDESTEGIAGKIIEKMKQAEGDKK